MLSLLRLSYEEFEEFFRYVREGYDEEKLRLIRLAYQYGLDVEELAKAGGSYEEMKGKFKELARQKRAGGIKP